MSDHGTHHHHEGEHHAEPKSKTSFRASFWFVLILVGLFIAAVNFVSVMSHEEGGHEATEQSEALPHEAAGHESTPDHAASHEDMGEGAANVHTTGTSDASNMQHGSETPDSGAHHE